MTAPRPPVVIYRLVAPETASAALAAGRFEGEAIDARDGFIHCSARGQIEDTLIAHFQDADRLALLEIDAAALGASLKWEASRRGEDFPHVYGAIPASAMRAVHILRRDETGAWRLPEDLPE